MQKAPPSEGPFVLPKPKPMREITLLLSNKTGVKRLGYIFL